MLNVDVAGWDFVTGCRSVCDVVFQATSTGDSESPQCRSGILTGLAPPEHTIPLLVRHFGLSIYSVFSLPSVSSFPALSVSRSVNSSLCQSVQVQFRVLLVLFELEMISLLCVCFCV